MPECPHSASDDLVVVTIERDPVVVLAVKCNECGAQGPQSESPSPAHAIAAWNLRYGRLSVVR